MEFTEVNNMLLKPSHQLDWSQAESNMNDLISEYQQYQEATVDDDEYEGDGDDLEQDEAQCVDRLCSLVHGVLLPVLTPWAV